MAHRPGRLRILLVTGNRNKAREIEEILAESFPGAFEVEISGDTVRRPCRDSFNSAAKCSQEDR
jgi:inosine/xanthosine triphosphate pyrophosphatase family protein